MSLSKRFPIMMIIVSFLMFFSGLAALIYQVIWIRILHYTYGNTEMAAATVMAIFMGGLSLGGVIGGKYAHKLKKPILAYGILEGIIAVYGLLITPLMFHLDFIYSFTGAHPNPVLMMVLKFLAGGFFMIIPTVAMGATLPIIVHSVVDRKNSGKGISLLYFINTFGAVVGTFITGFYLIPKFGLDKSVWVAVITGILVLLISIFAQFKISPKLEEKKSNKSNEEIDQKLIQNLNPFTLKYSHLFALGFAFLCGFISLSNEILWFRLLGILLDGTIYGFSALLSAFLLGLAFGSLYISTKLDKSKDLWTLFTKLQIGAAIGSLITIMVIPLIPFLVSGYIQGGKKTAGDIFSIKVILVFVTILVPTFFYGASFPVVVRLASIGKKVSKAVGNVYAVNTLGCILGSILTGLVLIPVVKNINLLLVIMLFATLFLTIGSTFLAGGADFNKNINTKLKLFGFITFLFFGIVYINPNVNVIRIVNSRYSVEDYQKSIGTQVLSIYGGPKDSKNLVFEAEGALTVVTVHTDKEGGYRLRNNGLNESYHAISQPYYAEEIFYLGALPYLLHPNAKKGLLIGLGGGGTLDVLEQTNLEEVEVAELVPEVVQASRIMFHNRKHPVDSKKVKLRVDDGRNILLRYARNTPHTFDIIVSQPSHPWLSGAANLYTVEHFKIVRKNLTKNGIFCQWVNLFRMNSYGYKSLMGAFTKAFPDGYVFSVDDNSIFMIGVNGSIKIDPQTIKKHFEEKGLSKLVPHYSASVSRVLKMYRYDYKIAKSLAKGAVVNSDHMPVIETILPKVDHNKMFSVENFLVENDFNYGITPESLSKNTDIRKFYNEYFDYLINEVEIDTEDIKFLKEQIKFIDYAFKQAGNSLGDLRWRKKSDFNEKLKDYETAIENMSKIANPTKNDLRRIAKLNTYGKNYRNSAIIYGVLFFKNQSLLLYLKQLFYKLIPHVEFHFKFDPQSLKNGDYLNFVRMFNKTANKFFMNPLKKQLLNTPHIKNSSDVYLWKMLAEYTLDTKKVNREYLIKYIDLGGEDPKLVKKMLIYYAKQNVNDEIDNLISVIKTSSNTNIEDLSLSKKLIKLGVHKAAKAIIKKLYYEEPDDIEPLELKKGYIKIKILTKDYKDLGKLISGYIKMSKSQKDEMKWLKEQLKPLVESERILLLKGIEIVK
jgi:spermidine synthase